MNTHADKTQKDKSQSGGNTVSQKQISGESTFQLVDNRPEALAQRKLKEMANNSPQSRKYAQLKAMADNYSSQKQKTIQRRIWNDEQTKQLSLDEVLKIAEERGIREIQALFALHSELRDYTISEALQMTLEFQHENEMRLTSEFDYDSDTLSQEDFDESRDVTMERTKGSKPGILLEPDNAVKYLARSKRRMLGNRATERDRVPALVDTTGGGHFFEIQPNPVKKDMGAYKTHPGEDGSFKRDGVAEKYGAIGKRLDAAVSDLRITHARANELIVMSLQGQNITQHFGSHAKIFGEFMAILLTDMARGSKAKDLIFTMLSDNSSFSDRLKEGGTYLPASRGGTKFIREHTDQYQ
jgi:hypothetical protein